MTWFCRDLNPGPLAPLPNILPLDQGAKEISLKKTCLYEIPLISEAKCIGTLNRQVFLAKFPLLLGLGVARSARVREVPGSNPGETRT